MSTVTPETEDNQLSCIQYSCVTHVGMRREENQDSYGVIESDFFKFYIVADGMGGVQGGAIASTLAVDVVKAFLADRKEITRGDIMGAVGAANHAIFEKGMDQPSLSGMGTTFVGLCFYEGNLFVVNVGDSRAYLVRGEQIGQLTEDHTLISELLKSGAITEDQVANHPVAHMLTRSLGPTEEIEIDCMPIAGAPKPGDKFVLCSDGLYNHVDQHEVGEVVYSLPAEQAAEQLVSLANDRGGSDNITVMVVEVSEDYAAESSSVEDTMELGRAVHIHSNGDGELQVEFDPKEAEKHFASDIGDVDTVEEFPALNGSTGHESAAEGGEESDSPEIAPTVGGASQERLIQRAMEKAGSIESNIDMPEAALPTKGTHLIKFAIVTVCVAFGTFGALYFNAQSSSGMATVKQEDSVHKEEKVPVPAVDSKVFAAASKDSSSDEVKVNEQGVADTVDAKQEEVPGTASDETSDKSVAIEKVEVARAADPAPEKESASRTEVEKPSIIAKMDKIKQQIAELEKVEKLVKRRLDSFSKPLSGSSGLLLADATRALEDIKKESDKVLVELEDATKKLSVWYGQKQRLKSTQILKIASEVAPLSETVALQKKKFEDVTWQFLKKREELQYAPKDEKLQKEVDGLIGRRKEELKSLNTTVRDAIEKEMESLDTVIADLTLKKEGLDVRAIAATEELEYVQALMSQDPKKQAATKAKLQQQLDETRKEKESLQELFSSLYDEVATIDTK
jgi:protein phosphatase